MLSNILPSFGADPASLTLMGTTSLAAKLKVNDNLALQDGVPVRR